MAEGNFLEVVKAIYGLTNIGNMWHTHSLNTVRATNFKPTNFDVDVWIRGLKGGYNYIYTHTDDVLAIAVNPTYIFNKMNETYKIKAFGPPTIHIGCDYQQVERGVTTRWVMVIPALHILCKLLERSAHS